MTFMQAYHLNDNPTMYKILCSMSITWRFLYVRAWKESMLKNSWSINTYTEFAEYAKSQKKDFFCDIVKFREVINPTSAHTHLTEIKTISYLHAPFNHILQEFCNVQNTQKA